MNLFSKICAFLFLIFQVSCLNNSKKKIGIQLLGVSNVTYLHDLSYTLKMNYGFDVCILPVKELPKSAFIHIKSPRYRADLLIKYLSDIKPDTIDYIIGVTEKDISTTKKDGNGKIKKPMDKYKDWGVFGLGYRPGPSCVISSFRIGHSNKTKFLERLKKVAVHELGHNLGLPHCKTARCVMNDAVEKISTLDHAQNKLCAKCKLIIMQ